MPRSNEPDEPIVIQPVAAPLSREGLPRGTAKERLRAAVVDAAHRGLLRRLGAAQRHCGVRLPSAARACRAAPPQPLA